MRAVNECIVVRNRKPFTTSTRTITNRAPPEGGLYLMEPLLKEDFLLRAVNECIVLRNRKPFTTSTRMVGLIVFPVLTPSRLVFSLKFR